MTETITHRWRGRQPSVAIIEAVAAATGHEPTELPPLHDYIEEDGLDTLLTHGRPTDDTLTVTFVYDGVEVYADSDGRIEVQPDPAVDVPA